MTIEVTVTRTSELVVLLWINVYIFLELDTSEGGYGVVRTEQCSRVWIHSLCTGYYILQMSLRNNTTLELYKNDVMWVSTCLCYL